MRRDGAINNEREISTNTSDDGSIENQEVSYLQETYKLRILSGTKTIDSFFLVQW
jgi:hypothetical protein